MWGLKMMLTSKRPQPIKLTPEVVEEDFMILAKQFSKHSFQNISFRSTFWVSKRSHQMPVDLKQNRCFGR